MLNFSNPVWPGFSPRRWQREAFAAVADYFGAFEPDNGIIYAIMGSGKSVVISEVAASLKIPSSNYVVVISTSSELLVEQLYSDAKARCLGARSIGVWYGRRKMLGDVIITCLPSVGNLTKKLKASGKTCLLWIADECHKTESAGMIAAYSLLDPIHSLGFTATPFRSDEDETLRLFQHVIYRYGVADAQKDGVVVPWRIVHAAQATESLDEECFRMIEFARGPGLANAVDIDDAESFAALLTAKNFPARAIHSRLSPTERKAAIAALKTKKIKCLVHVNMLAEGANYPWLEWLLLRRQVEARIRFIQEVGRLLRSCDGKPEAVYYDPHDLFGTFNLSYAEALGEPQEKPGLEIELPTPEEMAERVRSADPPVAMAYIESVARRLTVAADSCRILGPRKAIQKAERLKPSTPIQRAALAQMSLADPVIPPDWKECLQSVADRPDSLRFGFASDLICVLVAVKKHRLWPPIDEHGRIRSLPTTSDPCGQLRVDFARL